MELFIFINLCSSYVLLALGIMLAKSLSISLNICFEQSFKIWEMIMLNESQSQYKIMMN